RMKKLIGLMAMVLMVAGCSKTTPEDVAKILNDNPDILFKVMENNAEKFIKSAQTAAQKARPQRGGGEDEQAQLEAEFKNPKNPAVVESRLVGAKEATVTIVEYTD